MKYYFSFVFVFFAFISFSQRTISGRVTQTGSGALAGVKVSAKDAPMIFTLTNEYGEYKLEVPEEVKSLVYSFSGMATKTVKLKEFNVINVKLVPAKYKPFRFGAGIAGGSSLFSVYSPDYKDTTVIDLIPFSLHADFFYRLNSKYEIQAIIEDGFNGAEVPVDSVTANGDTVQTTEKTGVNRFTVSLLFNYHIKLDKTGNTTLFLGAGPQFQHLSSLETNSLGGRLKLGININSYGFTTSFYYAADFAGGKFGEKNAYVPGYPYKYFSNRVGVVFIF